MTEKMTATTLHDRWWSGRNENVIDAWGCLADEWNALLARAEKAEAAETHERERSELRLSMIQRRDRLLAERDAEVARLRKIIARDDTTTSYKCADCGSYHLRAVDDADALRDLTRGAGETGIPASPAPVREAGIAEALELQRHAAAMSAAPLSEEMCPDTSLYGSLIDLYHHKSGSASRVAEAIEALIAREKL